MKIADLGQLVKNKYQQYIQQPAEELGRRVADKFPEYRQGLEDYVDQSVQKYHTLGDMQKRYGESESVGYVMSGGDTNPALDAHNWLQEKNLPGQVITGALANIRANDPQYQSNVKMSQGQSLSDQERARSREAGMSAVVGMIEPMGKVKSPVDDLLQEAKKYGSAEEFRNYIKSDTRDKLRAIGVKSLDQYEDFWLKSGAGDVVRELDTLNPTGTVNIDYNPTFRAKAPLAKNMTTLNKTLGKKPTETITIYRGVPEDISGGIRPGDFITTDLRTAKTYGSKILTKKVKLGDILDDVEESGIDYMEFIYRPNAYKEIEL